LRRLQKVKKSKLTRVKKSYTNVFIHDSGILLFCRQFRSRVIYQGFLVLFGMTMR